MRLLPSQLSHTAAGIGTIFGFLLLIKAPPRAESRLFQSREFCFEKAQALCSRGGRH